MKSKTKNTVIGWDMNYNDTGCFDSFILKFVISFASGIS
jgi:hypothetical protein